MSTLTRRVLGIAVLLSIAGVASAQEATLQVGGRARVRTLVLLRWSYGRVISIDSGGLRLAPRAPCEGSEIPKAHIVKLQASAGHTGRSYALEGAIAGTISGVVLGHANGERHRRASPGETDVLACTNSCAVTEGELVGGLLGVVAGTTVGAFFHHQRWDTVNPWPSSYAVPSPKRGA